MKLNVWLVCAWAPLTAVLALAQNTAPAPPPAPAPTPAAVAATPPAETAAAAPKKKAFHVKKRVAPVKRVVLDPPAPAVVKSANVNVRGLPSFVGETLGHLQKGDTVSVSEQITLSRTTADEPAKWARIALPAGIPVWVDGDYVNAEEKTIKARRLNVRGGPGENYSVLGHLEKGDAIKEIKREKGWIAIEAPTNAYAFVAAEFLDLQPAPALAAAPPPTPAPAPEQQVVNVPPPVQPATPANEPAVAAPAPAAPAPVPPPTAPQPSEVDQEIAALRKATAAQAATVVPPPAETPPAPAPAPAPAASTEPVTPRVVTREGFVRRAYNIQAPTDFELHDIQSGNLIDYLQPKAGQNFKIFVGTRVTVTGPEGMDPRWARTPVLQVQSVDLLP